MPELTYFYDADETDVSTTTGTGWTDTALNIPGASLSANTKYLVVVRGLFGTNNAGNFAGLRASSADDANLGTLTEWIEEPEQTGADALVTYLAARSYTTDASPADVIVQYWRNNFTVRYRNLSLWVLDLDSIGTEGVDYFEDAQPASGDEYSITPATTVLAQIAGSDMGTAGHVIFGTARVGIGSTGRWWEHSLYAAVDAASATLVGRNRSEGEDTNGARTTGFAIRHKASSGTPNCTLYGLEEHAAANAGDEGASLIAIPSSVFADVEWDYPAGAIAANGETTIATVTFTPSVDGNHLVFGRSNVSAAAAGLVQTWVEDDTTEIRTDDSTPTHTQNWDDTKDLETAGTFQRYSITGSTTLNLQGDRNTATGGLEHRWLLVVNLNEPAVAAVYPPFPRPSPTHVRM